MILYRCSIDTVSILYRYCIDIVSIPYRYSIDIACKNPKTGCFWGRKTEGQVLGSENRSTGELWGRLGVALGGQRGGQGGSGEGRGRPPAAEKNIHFVKFKIMKLCGGFSLLLKRLEMVLNEFFDDIFSESPFFLVFSGVIYSKNSGIVFR